MESMLPLRKRTEKACDHCRRRKTKCNGKRNCSRCADFGYKCTYGEQAGKSRSPAQHRRAKDLEEARDSPSSALTPSSSPQALRSPDSTELLSRETSSGISSESSATASSDAQPEWLNTMCYPPGFGIPKANQSYLYGSCSGIEILRRMRVSFDAIMGYESSTPATSALTEALDRPVPGLFNSPTSAFQVFSPQRDDLLHLVDVAFTEGFWFGSFVDREFVEAAVDRVYSPSGPSSFLQSKNAEMALVYAIAAIGECLDRSSLTSPTVMDELGWKGVAYFRTVQGLADPMHCESSLLALQTVTCMAMYLITVSAVSRAHMYIGMAAAASMRMGLHLPSTGSNVPYHERIMRKRTYRSIMAMDIYMATFLGQPCSLQGVNGYQDCLVQSEMDEEAFHHPSGETEIAAEACMEAFTILRSASQEAYFSGSKPGAGEIYSVPSTIISSHNKKLEAWFASLSGLNLSNPVLLLAQQTGAYAEMIINSPFLYYLTIPASNRSRDGDAVAATCLMGAIRTIELLQAMKACGSLNDAHSFSLRSLAFASIALLYVELCGREVPSIDVVRTASHLAEELLRGMAMRHSAALRCYESLLPLYDLQRQMAQSSSDFDTFGHYEQLD